MQTFVDTIVLSKLVPPEVVGWYGAARNIMGVLFAPALILSHRFLSLNSPACQVRRRICAATARPLEAAARAGGIGGRWHVPVRGRGGGASSMGGATSIQPLAVLQVFAPVLPLFFIDILLGFAIIAAGKTKELAAVKLLSVAVSTGLAILLIPVCQARLGNGGIGSVLAFGSSEVLMLAAFLWLLPRGAVDRSALLDFLRAAAAAGVRW